MYEETKARKITLGYNWVKAESGTTYLCPIGENLSGASEDELRARCLDESHNPQNN
jgi:hypothetical protein